MITLFDLWLDFIGEANTHQGGHVKPHLNFTRWVKNISIDIFNDLVEEFEKTKVISDKLQPFLKTKNIIVTSVSAQMWDVVKLPDDYEYFASARVLRRGDESCGCKLYDTIDGRTGDKGECSAYLDEDELAALQAEADDRLCEIQLEKIPNARWSAVCSHPNLAPTLNSAKCTLYDGGLKLAPKRMGVIILDYFRKPKDPTFLYTITNPGAENEYIQYDATNSQPLEWAEKMRPEFIERLKKKYGVFVREPLVIQTTENKNP